VSVSAVAHLPHVLAGPRLAAPHGAAPGVSLANVERRFGERVALVDVSLEVARGEIHALVGPNGAGKTTLLRVVAGLMTPTSGSASILGRDHRRHGKSLRQEIGLVPSGSRSFYLRISALENLVFFGRMYGLRRREAVRRAEHVLADVGLDTVRDMRVQELSTGMQRRLATARALLAEPSVLLIDEATHDLDPRAASNLRALVREIASSRGVSTMWATQRVEEIRGFADKVTVLDRGTVRYSGAVAGFLRHAVPERFVVRLLPSATEPTAPAVTQALLGIAEAHSVGSESGNFSVRLLDDHVLGHALDALSRGGFVVVACSEERPGAEEAFLQLTSGA
jgi:ABC-2 type transport system ATP-binding protein